MRFMTVISIAASAVLGILAVFLVRGMISKSSAPEQSLTEAAPVETVSIVVAAQDIAFGDALKTGRLKLVQWPKEAVPKDAFSSLEPFAENNKTWRSALVRMARNEPVLAFKVSGEGQRQSLSLQIGIDMRAFAIRTNQASGVGGFILPGDSVDVLLVRTLNGEARSSRKAVSDLIVQNVRVLGVDQNADAASEKTKVAKTVTIEVSARDAQRLALAVDLGNLSLTLRRAGSEKTSQTRQITLADLKVMTPVTPRRGKGNRRTNRRPRTLQVAVIRPETKELVSVPVTYETQNPGTTTAKAFASANDKLEGGIQP